MNPLAAYIDGLRTDWRVFRRAFVPGPAVVEPSDTIFGHDDSAFSPPEYLDYIATSNNVYTCVTKRATAMASLPLRIYRGRSKDNRTEVEDGDLRDLLDRPNPWQTFDHLIHLTEQYLSLSGEAFWFLERGRSGRQTPREIWPVRPDLVRIVPDAETFIRGVLLDPQNGQSPISYTPDEVIWFAHPNPKDPYSGLAPLAAARLAADTASAAMHSNRNIFANGTRVGGVLSPADNTGTISKDQAQELQEMFRRGFKGVDKAHLMAVLAYSVKFQQWNMTPKDAEFLGALNWSLEDIARAFGIAPDLLGGAKRTYQNAPEARYAFWADTILPEARFIERVITHKLLPMFPRQADVAEFDTDDVDALRENEDAKWAREQGQLREGVLKPNEWRADNGLDPVPWGDAWWAPNTLLPVTSDAAPALPAGDGGDTVEGEFEELSDEERSALRAIADGLGMTLPELPRRTAKRAVEYGSADHERILRQFDRRVEPHERRIATTTVDLMRRQRRAVLDRLTSERSKRTAEEAADNPFDRPRWIRTFREAIRPVFVEFVEDAGQAAADDLGIGISFDVSDPNVVRFLERKAQNYAKRINETTYQQIKETLADGIEAGEGIDALAERVQTTMGGRIRDAEMIARTESTAAANGGTQLSWEQSGVVRQKGWIATLDSRVRPTHRDAHGQVVPLRGLFRVGAATGPSPGNMSSAAESDNCRCTMVAMLDVEPERVVSGNGTGR